MSAGANITYDDKDPAFLYQPLKSWTAGLWNASNVGQTGTLHVTNSLDATVNFSFPVAATAFFYYGMQRSRGGLFAICVDCTSAPSTQIFASIDAFNATDDGKNPPVLLYQQRFSAPAVHHIIIKNMADPRGTPAGNSQLTVQRIELEVQSSNTPSPVVSTSSFPSSSKLTAIASTSSTLISSGNRLSSMNPFASTASDSTASDSAMSGSTTSVSAPTTSRDARVQSKPSIGILLGALAVLAFILSIIVLIYWFRLQRKYARAPPPLNEDASALRHSRHSGADRGHIAGAPSDEPSDSPSQAAPGSAERAYLPTHPRRGHRRRERDLGPLPTVAQEGTIVGTEKGGTDKVDTLPPAYGKVFAPRRQPRQTRRNAARRDEYAEIR